VKKSICLRKRRGHTTTFHEKKREKKKREREKKKKKEREKERKGERPCSHEYIRATLGLVLPLFPSPP
jgi:hypothetical protein